MNNVPSLQWAIYIHTLYPPRTEDEGLLFRDNIIYTPNLGLRIAVSVREREQGRFRGSTEGAKGGAPRKQGGAVKAA